MPRHIISALLIAQAFCAVTGAPNSLMRKKTQVAVNPHGDIITLGGASLLDRDEYESKSAQELLTEVQDLVKNGDDAEGIVTIQKLVDEEILPGLHATRDVEQATVNKKLDAIKSCNTASTTKQNAVKSDEQSTDTAREAHAACRQEEKNKNSASTGRCKELDNFLAGINSPATLPGGREREGMVKYVEEVSTYFCPGGESKGDEVTKLDDACTQAEAERAKHQAECTAKQTQFESDFCTWRAELMEACNELGSCYTTAVDAWKTHVDATKPLVEKWKVEFKSLHKIKCYVSVFMNDNNAKTVDASQYEKCKTTEADDSAMNVDFGTPADRITCDLSPVSTYPGTTAFPTTEYSAFSDLVAAPLVCLGSVTASVQPSEESTQTVQPETEAPTTTEAPATTTTLARELAGNLGSGIACNDGAGGTGFIMYSQQNVHTRFTANKVHPKNADHFVCVRYDEGWKYDTNSKWIDFSPADSDILVATADFANDKVSALQGSSGMYQNMKHGYATGDLKFEANKWDPMKYAKGEFTVAGTEFSPQASYLNDKSSAQFMAAGDLGSGLACNDGAKGTGFIMYSVADLHSRFPSIHGAGAHHFLCVRYDQGWKYDTNSKLVSFTPADGDVLVASADFSLDTVTDLQGAGGMYQGVKHGYASGDLTFTANKWQEKKYEKGEFHVAGKGFTPQEDYTNSNFNSAGDLGNGLACKDNAKGTGYIMYSESDVHERFKDTPVHPGNAHHFVCVRYDSGTWKYDTNSKYVAFTPCSTDVLVAAANYGEDTVQDLKGSTGTEQSVAKGYASGDLTFTANKWDPMKYAKGEFHVGGTGFNPNQ